MSKIHGARVRVGSAWTELRLSVRRPRIALRGPTDATSVIVSLTSFPARIDRVRPTLWSLLSQSRPPDRLVLVLAEDDFPDRHLPSRVTELESLGVEFRWVVRNIGSYKKLIPILADHPSDVIVTADDDVLYPRDWLADLLEAHKQAPDRIIAHRAYAIAMGAGRPLPYLQWRPADTRTPSRLVFPTGRGGILYPPAALSAKVFDVDLALQLCPYADDIWFKAMSLKAGTRVGVVSGTFNNFYETLFSQQKNSLSRTNWAIVNAGDARTRNDYQLAAVFDHFDLWSRLG
jgi:Glycosyl transferase family 2